MTRVPSPSAPASRSACEPLVPTLAEEIRLMLRFAWSRGIKLPPEALEGLSQIEGHAPPGDGADAPAAIAVLAATHANLTRAIAPALPVTLRLMDAQAYAAGWRGVMGPIANVRRLTAAAFAFLAVFVGISLSPTLTARSMDADIYAIDGLEQFVVMAFLLSAAGIGGTFQALFTAQRYVADSNYDPRYDGSYWILIALGLVAGLLLAVLLPVSLDSASSPTMAKPLFALLGGFSSGSVYRILQRLVDTVGSLLEPRPASH